MGILASYIPPPDFAHSHVVSATDLGILRRDVTTLDMATRIGRTAFAYRWDQDAANVGINPVTVWDGAFVFQAGMTTLTIILSNAAPDSGDTLRVLINGAGTTTTIATGAQTVTRTINASGFVDGQVVTVRLQRANGPGGDRAWTALIVTDVFASPVTLLDAYPGVPTFGDITEARLDQLSNAVSWLGRRVGRQVYPLFMSINREIGPFTGRLTVSWLGSVRRTHAHTGLRAFGVVNVLFPGASETVVMRVNGADVATYSVPSIPGAYGFILTHTLSTTVDAVALVEVVMLRASGPAGNPEPLSRFTLLRVSLDDFGASGPVSIGAFTMRSSSTFTDLQGGLNAICAAVTAIKGRIDAIPDIWGRQRPFRTRFSVPGDGDDLSFQNQFYTVSRIPLALNRIGEALIVRGAGLVAGWGPGAFEDEPDENGLYPSRNFTTETLVEGDIATRLHYLDTFDGLYPGGAFNIRGKDVIYAGEQLRVFEA